jgi:HEAT repeat protein
VESEETRDPDALAPGEIEAIEAAFLDAMASQDMVRAEAALSALISCGEEVVPFFRQLLLGSQDEGVRAYAAEVLAAMGSSSSYTALLDALTESDDGVAVQAATEAIARWAEECLVERLTERYAAVQSEAARSAVIEAIAAMETEEAAPALMSLAVAASESDEGALAKAALTALCRVGNAPAVDFVLPVLATMSVEQAATCEDMLVAAVLRRPEVLPGLIAARENRDTESAQGVIHEILRLTWVSLQANVQP